MRNNVTERTKSGPRRLWNAPRIVCAALVVLLGLALLGNQPVFRNVRLGHATYHLQIVDTRATRDKGLGDRDSLPTNDGMLFAYRRSQNLCFWMKDMHFPLDVVWLNSARQVVAIRPDIAANSYPKTFCTTGQYVIEVNAGQAYSTGLRVGQTVHF